MIQLKVKFFNHATRAWEYLQSENGDALFDSHPDARTTRTSFASSLISFANAVL